MERTVHLGNVSSYVQEDAIRELLGPCGTIRGVRCGGERSYDTRYWFVEFSTHREAQSACLFDNTILGDRKLRVSMAKKPKFGDSLPTGGATPNPIPPAALMLAPGVPLMPQPLMASILPPGYNLQPAAALAAPRRRQLMHNPKKVSRTIYIQNMDRGFMEQDVADHFSPFGEVTAVRISDSCASSRRAWVEFADEGSVSQALCLDGETFGSCVLKISRSRTAIHTNGLERPDQDVPPPGTTRYGDDPVPSYQSTHFLDSGPVDKVSLGVRKRDPSEDGRSPDRDARNYKRPRGEAIGLESSS